MRNLTAPEKLENEMVYIINNAIKNKHNCIFYGKAGYGKSEITTKHLLSKVTDKYDVYIQDFSIGTTEARLKGGIDAKLFLSTGQLVHLIDDSFMVKPYAIFEEFFDAHPEVLNSLKAILTRKEYIQGKTKIDLKTKSIFALTNTPPEDIARRDEATSAMVDRFQLRFKVEWETYTVDDYLYLMQNYIPAKFLDIGKNMDNDDIEWISELAELAVQIYNNDENSAISPRDFVAMAVEGRDMIKYSKAGEKYKAIKASQKDMENLKLIEKINSKIAFETSQIVQILNSYWDKKDCLKYYSDIDEKIKEIERKIKTAYGFRMEFKSDKYNSYMEALKDTQKLLNDFQNKNKDLLVKCKGM